MAKKKSSTKSTTAAAAARPSARKKSTPSKKNKKKASTTTKKKPTFTPVPDGVFAEIERPGAAVGRDDGGDSAEGGERHGSGEERSGSESPTTNYEAGRNEETRAARSGVDGGSGGGEEEDNVEERVEEEKEQEEEEEEEEFPPPQSLTPFKRKFFPWLSLPWSRRPAGTSDNVGDEDGAGDEEGPDAASHDAPVVDGGGADGRGADDRGGVDEGPLNEERRKAAKLAKLHHGEAGRKRKWNEDGGDNAEDEVGDGAECTKEEGNERGGKGSADGNNGYGVDEECSNKKKAARTVKDGGGEDAEEEEEEEEEVEGLVEKTDKKADEAATDGHSEGYKEVANGEEAGACIVEAGATVSVSASEIAKAAAADAGTDATDRWKGTVREVVDLNRPTSSNTRSRAKARANWDSVRSSASALLQTPLHPTTSAHLVTLTTPDALRMPRLEVSPSCPVPPPAAAAATAAAAAATSSDGRRHCHYAGSSPVVTADRRPAAAAVAAAAADATASDSASPHGSEEILGGKGRTSQEAQQDGAIPPSSDDGPNGGDIEAKKFDGNGLQSILEQHELENTNPDHRRVVAGGEKAVRRQDRTTDKEEEAEASRYDGTTKAEGKVHKVVASSHSVSTKEGVAAPSRRPGRGGGTSSVVTPTPKTARRLGGGGGGAIYSASLGGGATSDERRGGSISRSAATSPEVDVAKKLYSTDEASPLPSQFLAARSNGDDLAVESKREHRTRAIGRRTGLVVLLGLMIMVRIVGLYCDRGGLVLNWNPWKGARPSPRTGGEIHGSGGGGGGAAAAAAKAESNNDVGAQSTTSSGDTDLVSEWVTDEEDVSAVDVVSEQSITGDAIVMEEEQATIASPSLSMDSPSEREELSADASAIVEDYAAIIRKKEAIDHAIASEDINSKHTGILDSEAARAFIRDDETSHHQAIDEEGNDDNLDVGLEPEEHLAGKSLSEASFVGYETTAFRSPRMEPQSEEASVDGNGFLIAEETINAAHKSDTVKSEAVNGDWVGDFREKFENAATQYPAAINEAIGIIVGGCNHDIGPEVKASAEDSIPAQTSEARDVEEDDIVHEAEAAKRPTADAEPEDGLVESSPNESSLLSSRDLRDASVNGKLESEQQLRSSVEDAGSDEAEELTADAFSSRDDHELALETEEAAQQRPVNDKIEGAGKNLSVGKDNIVDPSDKDRSKQTSLGDVSAAGAVDINDSRRSVKGSAFAVGDEYHPTGLEIGDSISACPPVSTEIEVLFQDQTNGDETARLLSKPRLGSNPAFVYDNGRCTDNRCPKPSKFVSITSSRVSERLFDYEVKRWDAQLFAKGDKAARKVREASARLLGTSATHRVKQLFTGRKSSDIINTPVGVYFYSTHLPSQSALQR